MNSIFKTTFQKTTFFYLILLLLTPICSLGQTGVCKTHPPDSPSIPPGNFMDPVYLRIYIHVITRTDYIGGQTHQQVLEALSRLDEAFNPHNLFFIWDCNTNLDDYYINDDDLFEVAGGGTGVFTGQPWGNNNHDNGIDIYLFPEYTNPTTTSGQANNNLGETGIELFVGGSYANFNNVNPINMVTTHILSHEMGHCFGLLHPSQFPATQFVNAPTCDGEVFILNGGLVCDTPADPGMNYNVNPTNCSWIGIGSDANGDSYNPDETNIMGRSYPDCYESFTDGQGLRMRNMIANSTILANCIIPVNFSYQNHQFQPNTNTIIPAGE